MKESYATAEPELPGNGAACAALAPEAAATARTSSRYPCPVAASIPCDRGGGWLLFGVWELGGGGNVGGRNGLEICTCPCRFLGRAEEWEGWHGVETVQELGGWVWADLNLSGLSLSQRLGKLQNLLSLNCGPGAREKVCARVCI